MYGCTDELSSIAGYLDNCYQPNHNLVLAYCVEQPTVYAGR